MSDVQKEQLKHDLHIAYLLLLAQEQYERDAQKYENSKHYSESRMRCDELLNKLEYNETAYEIERTQPSPSKYLFIFVGHELTKQMVNLTANQESMTKSLLGNMNWVNGKRLYWVWGSSFITNMLSMLPPDFFNTNEALGIMGIPGPYTGTMSWALYYLRFSVHLSLLLKNTIKGPWLTHEEKNSHWWQLPWHERFQTQWNQRKFALLNDSLWATANLACFFWLTGSVVLEHWGSLLTIVLLIFDISVSLWDFAEQLTNKNKELHSLNEQISKLLDAENRSPEQEHLLYTLKKAKKQCKKNWEYKQYELYNNIAYAIGLMLAFSLMTLPFLPIAIPSALIISTIGTVPCFTLTVLSNAIQGGIEVHKEHSTSTELMEDHDYKLDQFIDLNNNSNECITNQKFLYLEIMQLAEKSEQQKQLVAHKTMHWVRSIILSVFTPAVILASLVFLPLGIGLGVLGTFIGLMICSSVLIDTLVPIEQKDEIKDIDEQKYMEFSQKPEMYRLTSKTNVSVFFQSPETNNKDNCLQECLLSTSTVV
jgi:hypothetical protein